MKTTKLPQINVYNKKVNAGHYEIKVVCEETDEIFTYTETDMQLIDALNDESGMYDMTQWDAMQIVINKASNGKY